jgi:hypothetical protein
MESGSQVPAGFVVGAIAAFFIVVVVFFLALNAAVCAILHGCFRRIPAEHRRLEPGLVWLLLIPCFGWIWNFFVYPRLAQSYQSYFRSIGKNDFGDCGAGLGWAYAGCALGLLIPFPLVPFGMGLAALVLLVLFLVKATQLKNQIPVR